MIDLIARRLAAKGGAGSVGPEGPQGPPGEGGVGVNPADYGLIADGASHPLSSVYGSLAAAQAVYPFATSLTQEIDYCALQKATYEAFGYPGAEHGVNSKLNKRLLLSSGAYFIGDDTWLLKNLVGGVIQGAGELTTYIIGNGAVLKGDGAWFNAYSDFGMETLGSPIAMVEIDGNVTGPGTTRGVQANKFTNVFFKGGNSTYTVAVTRLGQTVGGGAQGSENKFDSCHFYGGTEACYWQYGFNALNNLFIGGNFQQYSRHGAYVQGGTCMFISVGFQSNLGYTQYLNDGWDIYGGIEGAGEGVIVYACRTESMRFLYNAGAVPADIRACRGLLGGMSPWIASTPFGAGTGRGKAVKVLLAGETTNRVFATTTDGTSGATEPSWTTDGSPVSDGTIVWAETAYNFIDSATGSIDYSTVTSDAGAIKGPPKTIFKKVSADYKAKVADELIVADTTAGSIVIDLPRGSSGSAAIREGFEITVKKLDTSANTVTLRSLWDGFEAGGGTLVIPGGSRGYRRLIWLGDVGGSFAWRVTGND